MKKITMIIALMLSVGLISGCHTVNGFGQDVSGSGHAISRAAS